MTKFLLFLLSLLFLNQVCAEVTPSSYDSEHPDEDLHQNQIPPPNLQPNEEDVKHAILQLVENKIDTDRNNKLSVEEMREWLQVVHQRIIDDNVDRQWAYYGPTVQEVHSWEGYTPETKEVLGWDTFKKVAYPDELLKEDPSNPNYEGVHKLMRRSESRWNRADLNSDTVLTKDEFKGFVHPEEVEKLQTVLVDEALEDMDSDNDTLVTLDEYFNHLTTVVEDAEKSDPNWKQTHESHFHEYLDKNKDGKLDHDELKDWIIPKYNKHEAEAYRLMTQADEDKDGELSKSEISAHFQHFYAVLPPEFWNQFHPEEPLVAHDEL